MTVLMYNAAFNYITQATYAYNDDVDDGHDNLSHKVPYYTFKFSTCTDIMLNLRSKLGCTSCCCPSRHDRLALKALQQVKQEMSITNQIRLTRITKHALKMMFSNAEIKELGKKFRFNLVALDNKASGGKASGGKETKTVELKASQDK